MIVGVGVDLVSVNRFTRWSSYSPQKRRRVFTQPEIDYCCAVPSKAAERFAARFALKEAFFKAMSSLQTQTTSHKPTPFLKVCTALSCSATKLTITWDALGITDHTNLRVHHSLSHEKDMSIALVIIERLVCPH